MNHLLVCVMHGEGGGSNRIHLIVTLFQTTGSNLCIRLAVLYIVDRTVTLKLL